MSMTDQIKRKLQDEIDALEHELIHELPKEIKKAAALGDLSENAEYHMAKQRQEFVKARVRQIGKRLADLSMVNVDNIPRDRVGLGSTVKIFDNTKNEEMEYKLVTSEESDVAAGKISTTSPINVSTLGLIRDNASQRTMMFNNFPQARPKALVQVVAIRRWPRRGWCSKSECRDRACRSESRPWPYLRPSY